MPAHESVNLGGVRLHYARAGSGPLVLFLHGFPECWYQWHRYLEDFGREYTAVAPDLPGYNLSSKPAALEAYRLPRVVEHVRALARHLAGDEPVVLVGHDWGGLIAWYYAARHAEATRRVVIINAPHPAIFGRELRRNPAQQAASTYALLFRTPLAEPLLRARQFWILQRLFIDRGIKRGYFDETDRVAYLQSWSRPGALEGALNYYRAARLDDTQPLHVHVPTLVIWGERDVALRPTNLRGLERYVSTLEICRIPDASHWVTHEHRDEVIRAIRAFLTR